MRSYILCTVRLFTSPSINLFPKVFVFPSVVLVPSHHSRYLAYLIIFSDITGNFQILIAISDFVVTCLDWQRVSPTLISNVKVGKGWRKHIMWYVFFSSVFVGNCKNIYFWDLSNIAIRKKHQNDVPIVTPHPPPQETSHIQSRFFLFCLTNRIFWE